MKSWKMSIQSVIFRNQDYIKFQDAESPYAEEMKKELIAGFQNEEDFAYMKGYKPWKKLLAKY